MATDTKKRKKMLPTPSTSHVPYSTVYEPAEDSFLVLDVLSSSSESRFLASRFARGAAPLVVEVGSGSGVVSAFVARHARHIFGRGDVAVLSTDLNPVACRATGETVAIALRRGGGGGSGGGEGGKGKGGGGGGGGGGGHISTATYLASLQADLASPLRSRCVDVLVFNPPYVPTSSVPPPPPPPHCAPLSLLSVRPSTPPLAPHQQQQQQQKQDLPVDGEEDANARLLDLSYAGGVAGMEVTDRMLRSLPAVLSDRGCAYVLLCRRNEPAEVLRRVRGWGRRLGGEDAEEEAAEEQREGEGNQLRPATARTHWRADIVGSSGNRAGWEKLVVIRIWLVEDGYGDEK